VSEFDPSRTTLGTIEYRPEIGDHGTLQSGGIGTLTALQPAHIGGAENGARHTWWFPIGGSGTPGPISRQRWRARSAFGRWTCRCQARLEGRGSRQSTRAGRQ